jgi:hypothetical protein
VSISATAIGRRKRVATVDHRIRMTPGLHGIGIC